MVAAVRDELDQDEQPEQRQQHETDDPSPSHEGHGRPDGDRALGSKARYRTAVSTTRSPSAKRESRSGRRSKVSQWPIVTSSAIARPAAGACITP